MFAFPSSLTLQPSSLLIEGRTYVASTIASWLAGFTVESSGRHRPGYAGSETERHDPHGSQCRRERSTGTIRPTCRSRAHRCRWCRAVIRHARPCGHARAGWDGSTPRRSATGCASTGWDGATAGCACAGCCTSTGRSRAGVCSATCIASTGRSGTCGRTECRPHDPDRSIQARRRTRSERSAHRARPAEDGEDHARTDYRSP